MNAAEPVERWTCPTCLRTVVPNVPDHALHDAIRRAQERHAKSHARVKAAA